MNARRFHRFAILASIAFFAPGVIPARAVQEGSLSSRSPVSAPDRAQVASNLHHPSLLFVQNSGQFDSRVRFQLRGAGGTWWFADDALWLTVIRRSAPATGLRVGPQSAPPVQDGPAIGVHLRITFPSMSASAHLVADDPQPARMNYFHGQDTTRWQANVPTYGSARWEGVYPGMNLVFGRDASGTGLGLTVEAPAGADLSALQLHVEGANGLRLDERGRLVADTAAGPVALPSLTTSDGLSLQPSIAADAVTFAPFDSLRDVRDPDAPASPDNDPSDLLYSTFLGGSGDDFGQGIDVDKDGSAYVVGITTSSDFPITPGSFDPSQNGDWDITVTKLNASGSDLVYSSFLGGSGYDRGRIAVAADGSAYIAGYTSSADFPTTPGAYDTSYNGGDYDAYVAKLDPTGSTLVYSSFLGGSGSEYSAQSVNIAVDGSGDAFVSGSTTSDDFPTTPGGFDVTYNGGGDGYVAKMSPQGDRLVFSTFLGGSGEDCTVECDVVVDGQGAAYIAGNTSSADFPTTPGSFDTSYNDGTYDFFVAKVDSSGSTLVYSTFLGGSLSEAAGGALGIGVDEGGSAYLTGSTESADYPTTPGAFDTTFNGVNDAIVTKLNATGSALVYSTYLGGNGEEYPHDIAVGSDGTAHITVDTTSTNFPTTPGAYRTSSCFSGYDGAVAKFDASGSVLDYSTFLCASNHDGKAGIAVDSLGMVYETGSEASSDYPTTAGAFDTTYNGGADSHVSKLNPDLPLPMFVASIDPFYTKAKNLYRVGAHISIQNTAEQLVSGATVSTTVTTPGGSQIGLQGTTDISGTAQVSVLTASTGVYTFTVTGVSQAGSTYDPSKNVETSDSESVPTVIHVASITPGYTPSGSQYQVYSSFVIQDQSDAPVSGATIKIGIKLPDGTILARQITTDSSGTAKVSLLTASTGTYTFTVKNVQAPPFLYDPSQNVETSDSISVP